MFSWFWVFQNDDSDSSDWGWWYDDSDNSDACDVNEDDSGDAGSMILRPLIIVNLYFMVCIGFLEYSPASKLEEN